MSVIPTEYPVTLTDGAREYQVFDASGYNEAVFALGHRIVVGEPEQAELEPEQAEPAAE
jgi:hypothetical protein